MKPNLFISSCKSKFIVVLGDSPCMLRRSHYDLAKIEGLDLYEMQNKTVDFYYLGGGSSIKDFLK